MSQLVRQLMSAGLCEIQASFLPEIFQKLRRGEPLTGHDISLLQASRPAINKIPMLKEITDEVLG